MEKKSAETVNEYVIHINMYENDTETNWYTLEQVIDEWPYETSPVVMEYCVNEELDNSNQHYLIELNDTEVYD